VLSHHIGDCPRQSEIVDGTSYINCQQHDRLRNRHSYVSVWLYSSKPDLHLRVLIQHPVLGQDDSHSPDPSCDGGWAHGDDEGQLSLHSDRLGASVFCESKKFSHHCGHKREIVNRNPMPSRQTPATCLQVEHGLACLTLLLSLCEIDRPYSDRRTKSDPMVDHPPVPPSTRIFVIRGGLAGPGRAEEDDRLGAIQIATVDERTQLGCGTDK
jgi:hypothetical protein